MGTYFIAVPAQKSEVAELGALLPSNCFATASYFESMRQVGYATWVLGLKDDAGRLEYGCGAFFRTVSFGRKLEIPSLPAVGANSLFWDGLSEFCHQHSVTMLDLGTFGSPPGTEIPDIWTHCTRRNRCEFVLALQGDIFAMLSSNHKRNIKRAQKAGLAVRRTRSVDAAKVHLALMNQSMERRRSRGEDVSIMGPSLKNMALLQSGSGEFFQAICGETVLSSVLMLRAPTGGYYQSAGTSPEGMTVGASHFLIHSIACQLSADRAGIFNLGGAGDEELSLANFKEGFGASRVPLHSASCYIGSSWRRRLTRGLALMRSDRKALLRLLFGQIWRMKVYAADTATIRPPELETGLTFRALRLRDLQVISAEDPAFRERQLERLKRFGASYAYGMFVDGQIAHVSWLLPPIAIEKDVPRVLTVGSREAEITCCETVDRFRGRGIYGTAIRKLFEVARGQGFCRVYMKTAAHERLSQAAIEKVGLERIGSINFVALPVIQRLVVWRCFRGEHQSLEVKKAA
jgi:hypothetical protein